MPTTTATGATVPVGSDPYALTADLKKAFESARTIIPVQNLSQRNGLAALFPDSTLPVPTFVSRTDLGQLIQVWDGVGWVAGSGVDIVDLPGVDGNWSQTARVTVTTSPDGGARKADMALLLYRTGGGFSIPTGTWWPLLSNVVPAGLRPPTAVVTGALGFIETEAGAITAVAAKVDSTGTLQIQGVTGGVGVPNKCSLRLTISWVPA